MMKFGNEPQKSNMRRTMHLVFLILICLILSASSGCLRMLNLEVQNNTTSSITIISIMTLSEHGDFKSDRDVLGVVSPGSTRKFDNAFLDGDREFVLEIQDTSNKAIGEVRQSGDTVHAKLDGRTWIVKIPEDMTPLPAGKTAADPPLR